VFSILHISDLHRSVNDPISNDELMSALVGDRSRYVREDPAIRPPEAIVISGDIIQGVPLGTQDAPAKIASQYAAAEAFIVELTNRFLDGDRSKVVLIPGNHDIDWVTARSAMNLVGVEDQPKGNLASELFREDTPYRWSWKTRELYRIGDQATYARRLEAFWTFFERFYENVHGLLKVRPRSPANLYSLQDGRIGLSAFDSCHGNDCFAFHGSIPREVVARAHRAAWQRLKKRAIRRHRLR
jgi:Calcineurin-like phosphoesterase